MIGIRRGLTAISWYVGSVMGDRDYRRYVDHTSRIHPDEPILTEREYWRHRYAEQDRHPGARCC